MTGFIGKFCGLWCVGMTNDLLNGFVVHQLKSGDLHCRMITRHDFDEGNIETVVERALSTGLTASPQLGEFTREILSLVLGR